MLVPYGGGGDILRGRDPAGAGIQPGTRIQAMPVDAFKTVQITHHIRQAIAIEIQNAHALVQIAEAAYAAVSVPVPKVGRGRIVGRRYPTIVGIEPRAPMNDTRHLHPAQQVHPAIAIQVHQARRFIIPDATVAVP